MSLNAATIEILLAKGLTGADLLDVARAMEAKADRTNAERQSRHRAKKRNGVTVTALLPPIERDHTPPPSEPKGSEGKKRGKFVSIQVPEWMPAEEWLAMVAMRQGQHPKIPWSETAVKLMIAKIDELRVEGHCPKKLLQKAVLSGWRTVYPGDDTKATGPNGKRPLNRQELRSALAYAEDQGDFERVAELKRLIEACATGPPERRGGPAKPIGAIIQGVSP